MAEPQPVRALQEDQGGLPRRLDRAEVGLDQRGAPGAGEPRQMGVERLPFHRVVEPVAAGVDAAGADGWLEDHVDPRARPAGRSGLNPVGRDDRHPGRRELAEIALVGVPDDDVRRVGEAGDPARPGDELVTAGRVVPGGAEHDQVVGRPVDRRVVPDDRLGGDRPLGQRCERQAIVVLEVRNSVAGNKSDPGCLPGRRLLVR
ncbi:hypothetical protein Ais01nite_59030 [Asanoa ishikariensis]|nr:hypothetical protein Ais01nite_59030 [Asanoa ishikariensis]